jgi:8-oxo-dGTP pyrophosphatase MutT (NUDIX family)
MNKCNNCGKAWHVYKQCKYPITSIGIINVNEKGEYLMICRKKTLGYVEFIRGKYNFLFKHFIINLISEMTDSEKNDILTKTFYELWADLWKCIPDGNLDELHAKEKFNIIKHGCMIENKLVTLEQLIHECKHSWNEPEWGFPKGRRNSYESDLTCAFREYEEETGYDKKDVHIIKNILPYEEIFTGSNYKSYKHKYFIGKSTNSIQQRPFQEVEVSDLKWFSYEDAMNAIRPYNIERKEVLTMVHSMLSEYKLD